MVLSTSHLVNDDTAANIADELKRVTDVWGISNKVVAVVTDNASQLFD